MHEEEILKTTFGKANPFRVPDGYFENVEEHIISSLPEVYTSTITVAKEIPLWKRLRPYIAAAAFFGVMAGGYLIYHNSIPSEILPVINNVSNIAQNDDYNIDSAVDYVMMDNEDFYAYLTGE